MDWSVAESVIVIIGLAEPQDDQALRQLLRNNAVPGPVSLSYEREPSFFVASRFEGDRSQTIVARDAGRVIALGTRSTHMAYVNGAVRRIGYLSQLRLDRPYRGRAHLILRGYEMLRRLHEEHGDAPFYVTTLIDGNDPAERLLTAGHDRMPHYRRLEGFRTLVLRVKSIDPLDAPAGTVDEIRAHLDRHSAQFQFCRVWNDIDPDDFVVDADGCLALWDQSAFKQIVVRGYAPALRLLRPFLRLPRVGHPLRMAYLSHVACADGPALVRMIRAAAARARLRQIDYLILGLSERNPLLGAVRTAFSPREYGSTIYLVHWGDAPPQLDDRPCHLEVATL